MIGCDVLICARKGEGLQPSPTRSQPGNSKQRRKPFCFFNLSDIQSVFYPFKMSAFPGMNYLPEKGAVYKYNLIKPQKKRKKKMRKGFRSFSK
jgi:hypothetical protein